jgi:hypothetical protein
MWRSGAVATVLIGISELSNVSLSGDGGGLWNATCKGKVYLCSAAGSVGGSSSFSCAPVAN